MITAMRSIKGMGDSAVQLLNWSAMQTAMRNLQGTAPATYTSGVAKMLQTRPQMGNESTRSGNITIRANYGSIEPDFSSRILFITDKET